MLESRKKRKASSDGANGSSEMAMTVGRYLKTERESQGQDLPQVAEMLCIHCSYLQAIEDGEIDQLPGPTYAVGFVRTYAEHLGLDGNRVAERFKEEGKVPKRRAQLVLPSPMPEGQIPSLAVLLIAAVLLLVAYVSWVFVSSPDGGIAEMVPAVSDRFVALVDDGKGKDEEKAEAVPAAAPAEKTSAAVSNQAQQGNYAPPPTASSGSDSSPPKPEVMDTASSELAPEAAAKIASATAEKVVAESETGPGSFNTPAISEASSTTAAESEPPEAAKPASDIAQKPPKELPAASEIQSAAPTVAAAQTAFQPSEDDGPRVYGEANDGSRITIRAIVDSWVEVLDGEGEVLLTRVLREGDQYHVPDISGLALVTGNAGGLELEVDGEKVPKIGPLGAVRRKVRLEPQALKNGTASTR